jgi:hypothetical protein
MNTVVRFVNRVNLCIYPQVPTAPNQLHENGVFTKFDHSGAEMFPNLEFKAHAWETFR